MGGAALAAPGYLVAHALRSTAAMGGTRDSVSSPRPGLTTLRSCFISTETPKPNLLLLSSNAKWFTSLRCVISKMPTVIQHLLQGVPLL